MTIGYSKEQQTQGLTKKRTKEFAPKHKPTGESTLLDWYKSQPKQSWFCTGCGANINPLTHVNVSHIIQKSLRKDLVLDINNTTLHCFACHNTWDGGSLDEKYQLNDFDLRMKYIYKKSSKIYFSIVDKLKLHHGIDYKVKL